VEDYAFLSNLRQVAVVTRERARFVLEGPRQGIDGRSLAPAHPLAPVHPNERRLPLPPPRQAVAVVPFPMHPEVKGPSSLSNVPGDF